MKKVKNTQKGQSMFEVFLSLTVITVVIVALVILASNAIRNTTYSRNKTISTRYSQETIEWLRGERDMDWTIFSQRAVTSQYYCMQTLSWDNIGQCSSSDTIANTSLFREVGLTIDDPEQIEAEVRVYWEDSQGMHEVRTTTKFTDWRKQ